MSPICINADYNIFIIKQSLNKLVISIFINDIKIIDSKNIIIIIKFEIKLSVIFEIVDIRQKNFYLGPKTNKNC